MIKGMYTEFFRKKHKLSTIHVTAVPGQTIQIGDTVWLDVPDQFSTDTLHYAGPFLLSKQSQQTRFLFDGGYYIIQPPRPQKSASVFKLTQLVTGFFLLLLLLCSCKSKEKVQSGKIVILNVRHLK